MRCLTDAELQAAVDNEAGDAIRAHIADCGGCRARVEERRGQMAQLAALVEREGDAPASLHTRLRHTLASDGPVRGATALRRAAPAPSWRRVGWVSAFATAAIVGVIVFLVLPRLGAPTTLSASEILGRSLQTLSGTHGVELLEYELALGGVGDGPHRIEQLVDHEHSNRYRFTNYGPDGVAQSAIGQDSVAGRRSQLIRVDGRNYVFRFTSTRTPLLSLPDVLQAQVEAAITMMQATSDQNLTVVDAPGGKQYVIQIPPVTPKAGAGAMFDLYRARAVIDARDFRLREFEASGSMLKQPYTVSVKLIRQLVRKTADVSPSEFEIHAGLDDVVFEGEATNDPIFDMMGTMLRELGRAKGH